MRCSCATLVPGDSRGGAATVAVFLGGTGGDCTLICCSTAAWFTYGVGGMVGSGIRGDGVSTLGDVVWQLCMELLLLCDYDPVDPPVVLSRGSKSNLS